MSADQQTFNNELRGVLFRNDKGDNPARPDYRGRCQVDGRTYRISAWIRSAQATGAKFLSLSLTLDPQSADAPAQAAPAAQAAAAPQPAPTGDPYAKRAPATDDMPF